MTWLLLLAFSFVGSVGTDSAPTGGRLPVLRYKHHRQVFDGFNGESRAYFNVCIMNNSISVSKYEWILIPVFLRDGSVAVRQDLEILSQLASSGKENKCSRLTCILLGPKL